MKKRALYGEELRNRLAGAAADALGGTQVKSPFFLELSTLNSAEVSRRFVFSDVLPLDDEHYPISCSLQTTYTVVEDFIDTIFHRDARIDGRPPFSVSLAAFPSQHKRLAGFYLLPLNLPVADSIQVVLNDCVTFLGPLGKKMRQSSVFLDLNFLPPSTAHKNPGWRWLGRQAAYLYLNAPHKFVAEFIFIVKARVSEALHGVSAVRGKADSAINTISLKGETKQVLETKAVIDHIDYLIRNRA